MKKIRLLISFLFFVGFITGCAAPQISQPPAPAAESSTQTQTQTQILSPALENPDVHEVGFDIDDALLFSSPAFDRGYAGAEPYTAEFWKIINSSDEEVSVIKEKCYEILKAHQDKGHKVYLITSRNSDGGDALKKYLSGKMSIPEENIFFEPHGKTARIKELGIDAFYGDSDSDIRYAEEAEAIPIRILRSPKSSYKGSCNPGCFNEFIVPDSEE
ncbi:MAG: HAD family acid phosphatase [bacterium]